MLTSDKTIKRTLGNILYTTEVEDIDYDNTRPDFFSSHDALAFVKNPKLWAWQKTQQPAETGAMRVGRAFHELVLRGRDSFHQKFPILTGPKNPRTGLLYGLETAAFAKWKEQEDVGENFVLEEEYDSLCHMALQIENYQPCIDLFSKQEAFTELMVQPNKNMYELPVRGRLDYVSTDFTTLVDLKTTTDLEQFERQAVSFGYYYQIAFYAMLLQKKPTDCYFVAVEKQPPHRVGAFRVADDEIGFHIEACRTAIRRAGKRDFTDRFDQVQALSKPGYGW